MSVKVQRQEVVAAALALLDEVGMEGLTMRRLAQALGIQAPSLYWHFPGKQSLFDAMADAMLAELALPPAREGDWAGWLQAVAVEQRRVLKSRRDGARVYAGTFPVTEGVLGLTERLIAPLLQAGADERTAIRALFTIQCFVLGFTIEEQASTGGSGSGSGGVDLGALARQAADREAGRHPLAVSALTALAADDPDDRFLFGLRVLTGGLAAAMPAAAAAAGPPTA
ncbi:TetR/AcrR family transcriptional regulator C-terminal domain-containing protein [Azospirillum picis]|uniref:TetR/AcrR family tetracycline transcriptional repressor n=1 Tax=Azospirillum picis TaxID=488438 RepID=A0ABU0MHJ7_9PROT|nr:TetR/AcrR family transcriptional regulator C-terminal domain-containing protein [Azospirillum picis]MBP2298827.1 TetR/AcrR family tetracycline transcriptional repressor [Azospirillum picis]MDQ0532931.1 TetR/AcrR family tetracycline transcriptional repressor [Azospirillum picis]